MHLYNTSGLSYYAGECIESLGTPQYNERTHVLYFNKIKEK